MLRYLHRLESRDLSLNTSMIPLGSCTMKLNATSEMVPVTWPERSVTASTRYAPEDQTHGYRELLRQLESLAGGDHRLARGLAPAQRRLPGRVRGLLAIRRYHEQRGEPERDVCLIPVSAHGTNAASAVIAGFRCVAVACDEAATSTSTTCAPRPTSTPERLGALMITYPSTHGVFEEAVQQICRVVHEHGGQVYMDGANMNAQVGLTSPAAIGATSAT